MDDIGTQDVHGNSFRKHLPDLKLSRFIDMQKQSSHEYAEAFKTMRQPPWLHALFLHWRDLFSEPYQGITSDGMDFPSLSCVIILC